MSFVPVTVPPPASSPKAKELGNRLTATIDRFRQENPTVSSAEVKQAISLAMSGAGPGGAGIGIASVLAVLLLIFGALTFLYLTRAGLDFDGQPLVLMTMIGAGVVALAILAKALKNR